MPNPEKPPPVKEPVFSITSIKIMQAELINTRLKVRLHVNNPNGFPVELSSFKYALYGSGRLWAEGTEKKTIAIPASGSGEKELFLVMNFTNMRRDILDRIISMETVSYRFSGSVEINAETDEFVPQTIFFNLEGESEVER